MMRFDNRARWFKSSCGLASYDLTSNSVRKKLQISELSTGMDVMKSYALAAYEALFERSNFYRHVRESDFEGIKKYLYTHHAKVVL